MYTRSIHTTQAHTHILCLDHSATWPSDAKSTQTCIKLFCLHGIIHLFNLRHRLKTKRMQVPTMLQSRWQSSQPTDSHRSFTQASMDREKHLGGFFAGRHLEILRYMIGYTDGCFVVSQFCWLLIKKLNTISLGYVSCVFVNCYLKGFTMLPVLFWFFKAPNIESELQRILGMTSIEESSTPEQKGTAVGKGCSHVGAQNAKCSSNDAACHQEGPASPSAVTAPATDSSDAMDDTPRRESIVRWDCSVYSVGYGCSCLSLLTWCCLFCWACYGTVNNSWSSRHCSFLQDTTCCPASRNTISGWRGYNEGYCQCNHCLPGARKDVQVCWLCGLAQEWPEEDAKKQVIGGEVHVYEDKSQII